VPHRRASTNRAAGPGGYFHATSRLIDSDISGGSTWDVQCHGQGGSGFKGHCEEGGWDAAVKKVADDEVVVERAATDKRVMDATAGEKAVSDTRLSPLLLRWRELRGLSYQAALLPLPSIGSMAPGSPRMLLDPAFVLPFSMLILFHLDSSLCSVSPSSRTPTPTVDQAHGYAVGHDPQWHRLVGL
jgi:hypothetical protein